MPITTPDLGSALTFMAQWGWMVLPFILFLAWRELWLHFIRGQYANAVAWVTLELKIPNAVERTPKAMEQVFAGLHGIKSAANMKEKWVDGKHQLHMSMEMASIGGAIHFFIRMPQQFRRVVESQIYSQYKDAEITEVDDYLAHVPRTVPDERYDLWGTELIFTKDDAYPIRTYRFFEEPATEKKYIDPLAALMELFGELADGEDIIVQYLIRPTGDAWQKEGQRLVDKLIGKKSARGGSDNIMEQVYQFFYDMFAALVMGQAAKGGAAENGKEEKATPETLMQHLSPGMKDTVAALEESISKHGFEAGIRIVYVARTEVFAKPTVIAALGAFKQFSTYNLNGFKPNGKVTPSVDYIFVKTREYLRKRRLFADMINREFVRKPLILNTEELATVYHVPSVVLEVPMLPKIMAKKAEPPAGLPTI